MEIEKIHANISELNNRLKNSVIKKYTSTLSFDEKYEILKKNITENELNKKIIEYEFTQTKYRIINNIKELINIFIKELKKYQTVLGGSNIEDEEWIVKYYPDKCRFKMRKNTCVVYNTLSLNNMYDKSIFDFTNIMYDHIKKFTNKINIVLKIIKDNNNDIIWIVYKFTFMK